MSNRDEALKHLAGETEKHCDRARARGRMPNTAGGRTVWVTEEQYDTVIRAINHVRHSEEDRQMPEGVALELICGDYLAGV
jgi:hypothetical protein